MWFKIVGLWTDTTTLDYYVWLMIDWLIDWLVFQLYRVVYYEANLKDQIKFRLFIFFAVEILNINRFIVSELITIMTENTFVTIINFVSKTLYLHYYYYHWVDISAGGLLAPEGIILPVVSVSLLVDY